VIYRETGDFKTSYAEDHQIFPIAQDRVLFWALLALAVGVVPFLLDDYWTKSILLPFLVYSLAAIGLNILTGYCGQVSLGTGGFMAVGAYAAYKLMTAFPWMDMVVVVLLSGAITAAVGMLFGLPSLRIKGFYLAVATLAAQFFLVWLFNKVPWFYNYSATGQISAPDRTAFGVLVTGPNTEAWAAYLFCLFFVILFGFVAKNLTRGRIGRSWMAIRDMDIAAEIIGVDPLRAKLSAFGVSSFYVGLAGALYFAVWFGAVEVGEAFGINRSFAVLFMIIIGGLGSMLGSFLGAGFVVLLPILLKNLLVDLAGFGTAFAKYVEIASFGALIILFLIAEPHGLARLWAITKERLRLWPFPH
jgi:branched-chain amino acid transport system permease protein